MILNHIEKISRSLVRKIFRWVDDVCHEHNELMQYVLQLERLRIKRQRAQHMVERSDKAVANLRRRGQLISSKLESPHVKRWRQCYARAESAGNLWRKRLNAANEELTCYLEVEVRSWLGFI